MELHQLPTISTAHLTKEVAERLTAEGNSNPWITCASWDSGFFICTQTLSKGEGEDAAPKCLIDLKEWLAGKALHCSNGDSSWQGDWVRLDRDADEQDDLPVYVW